MFMKTNWKTAALAAAMAIGLGVSGAAASTVLMFGDRDTGGGPPTFEPDNPRGQIECSLGCDGWWLGDDIAYDPIAGDWDVAYNLGNWDGGRAQMLFGPEGSSEANYTTFVAGILGLDSTDPSSPIFPVVKTNVDGGPENFQFTTNAQWFTLTLGREPRVALFRSYWQGNVITYTGESGTGAGLSHYVEYGVAPIPLPAAGWLLLTALGGLGAAGLRRRRKDA